MELSVDVATPAARPQVPLVTSQTRYTGGVREPRRLIQHKTNSSKQSNGCGCTYTLLSYLIYVVLLKGLLCMK